MRIMLRTVLLVLSVVSHDVLFAVEGFVLSPPSKISPTTTSLHDFMDNSFSNVGTRNVNERDYPRPADSAPLTRYEPLPEGGPLTTPPETMAAPNTRMPPRDYAYEAQRQERFTPVRTLQGGSRGTWSAPYSHQPEQTEIFMGTEGRPLDAEVELWHGPNNTPQRVRVYSQDGGQHPFRAIVEAPRGSHSMSVRNVGPMEFPVQASVRGGFKSDSYNSMATAFREKGQTVQGGALKTFPFHDPSVASVQVSLETEGLPLMAVIELWQGPGNVKQLAEIYSDDGMSKPFRTIVDLTPGYGSTVAVRNVGPLEYPLTAKVEPVTGSY